MKILHVITSLHTGGAEKLMVDLLPRLKEHGHDVDLLLFDGTETSFRRDIEKAGIKVFDLGKGGSVYSPLKLIKLLPYLRKYDIIHTHNTAPQLFAAIGSMLCSVVLCTTEHTTSNRRRGSRWCAPIDYWMYSRYRKVICISQKTETALINSLKRFPTTTVVINNGIDIAKYTSAISETLSKKQDGCEIALMQVAGFRYQKDQKTVIRALTLLPECVHLYFVGDGEFKNECIEYAHEYNVSARTHFLGIRTDVPRILKDADIVIMSSHWEGFGLAAVEGMAAGKPVIASDVDGLREVVKGAGLLFEKGNETALATQIKSLIASKELWSNVASKCYERAQQFDISKMVKGYLNIYNQILVSDENHRISN